MYNKFFANLNWYSFQRYWEPFQRKYSICRQTVKTTKTNGNLLNLTLIRSGNSCNLIVCDRFFVFLFLQQHLRANTVRVYPIHFSPPLQLSLFGGVFFSLIARILAYRIYLSLRVPYILLLLSISFIAETWKHYP